MLKGLTLVSAVIFLAFLIAATAIIYTMGIPVIEKMQCVAATEKMKSAFIELDKIVQKVASEGTGSKKPLTLTIDTGILTVDPDNDTIYWKYECPAPVISPRTSKNYGNVIVGSNLETSAYEVSCSGSDAYVLENEHLRACLKKIGNETNSVSYNMSEVLLSILQKDINEQLPLVSLKISIDNNETTESGTGYTKLVKSGDYLPYGEAIAYINTTYISYRVNFILESGADFLIIRGSEI
jgi:hypothetical protein